MKANHPRERRRKADAFPRVITVPGINGITATIYRREQAKGDVEYVTFTVAYSLLGRRKLEYFSEIEPAVTAAENAIRKISQGEQAGLELKSKERDEYLRAVDILLPFGVALDFAAREYADARKILNGTGTIAEAVRYFMAHHSKELPRISVADAIAKCIVQAKADGKSHERVRQLEHYLNAFAGSMRVDVGDLTPGLVSRYLTDLDVSERTKKNARDCIGYFSRWCVLHGYLARGTSLIEGVQRYSTKVAEILIYSAEEMKNLLRHAEARILPYLVIGAFAGLRQAEIMRLDWSEVDLTDGFIEVKAEKAKTDTRRIVPIKPNLKTWLLPLAKKSGPVCELGNVVNGLMKLADDANTPWKKNGLRHSCISYRIAECADVPRVADESGNSPAVIKSNYLKRVKPAQAAEWFAITPASLKAKAQAEESRKK